MKTTIFCILIIATVVLIVGCTSNQIDDPKDTDLTKEDTFNYADMCPNFEFNTPEIDQCIQENYRIIELAVQKKDQNLCESLHAIKSPKVGVTNSVMRNECYTQLAIALKDKNVCKKAVSPVTGVNSGCYYDLAINMSDVNLCEEVSENKDDMLYKRCISNFS
ncbi:MAG: hypothetical protein GY861_09450 [bacterium]|nr:hypothetical protein [bacterium]